MNPKRFGPSEDFQKYPRTLDSDLAALKTLGVDCVFAPTPEQMYPPGFRTAVTVDGLSDRLEGRSRPGHFRGVTTVVLKLFEIVLPRLAFFGRKDAQQARVIHQMTDDLDLDTEIAVCPIVREADGLALSSRNRYLSADKGSPRGDGVCSLARSDSSGKNAQRGDQPARLICSRCLPGTYSSSPSQA